VVRRTKLCGKEQGSAEFAESSDGSLAGRRDWTSTGIQQTGYFRETRQFAADVAISSNPSFFKLYITKKQKSCFTVNASYDQAIVEKVV